MQVLKRFRRELEAIETELAPLAERRAKLIGAIELIEQAQGPENAMDPAVKRALKAHEALNGKGNGEMKRAPAAKGKKGPNKAILIAKYLQEKDAVVAFAQIRDDLVAHKILPKGPSAGRTVGVVLKSALLKRKWVKQTAEGWRYIGPDVIPGN